MPMSERPTNNHPPMWPSLLIAGILAVVVPFIWLHNHADPFGWWLVFLPYLAPLAFGVFWPAILAFQSVASPVRGPWLARHTTAVIVFFVCGPCWALLIKAEIRNAREERAGKLKQQQLDHSAHSRKPRRDWQLKTPWRQEDHWLLRSH